MDGVRLSPRRNIRRWNALGRTSAQVRLVCACHTGRNIRRLDGLEVRGRTALRVSFCHYRVERHVAQSGGQGSNSLEPQVFWAPFVAGHVLDLR